jgi:ribosomal protein S18 acetylase RimI-like enzyme
METHAGIRIDEAAGLVHATFLRMEYRGGPVTSDLAPKLILLEDRHYDLYQRVGNEVFAVLLRTMHSNLRQFFPRDEVRAGETYLWFEDEALVGSIRLRHDERGGSHELERVMIAPRAQGRGYGAMLLRFAVARLLETHRTPIRLTVAACNDGAVRFYERFGFVPVGEFVESWKIQEDARAT